jgi:SpoVK/Ycf46/Vps4 family AAA+-type ATPase
MERRRKVPFAADVAEDKFAAITDGLTPAEILACCRYVSTWPTTTVQWPANTNSFVLVGAGCNREAALLALTEDMNAAEVRWQHVDAAVKQRRQTGGLSLTEEALLPYNKFAHNRRT